MPLLIKDFALSFTKDFFLGFECYLFFWVEAVLICNEKYKLVSISGLSYLALKVQLCIYKYITNPE